MKSSNELAITFFRTIHFVIQSFDHTFLCSLKIIVSIEKCNLDFLYLVRLNKITFMRKFCLYKILYDLCKMLFSTISKTHRLSADFQKYIGSTFECAVFGRAL